MTPGHLDYEYPEQNSQIFTSPSMMVLESKKKKNNNIDDYQTFFNATGRYP